MQENQTANTSAEGIPPQNAADESPTQQQPQMSVEADSRPDDAKAQSQGTKKPKSKVREVLGWILAIGIAVAAAFVIRAFFFEFVLVEGPSMQPTLETGERIGIEKVTRYSSLPKRGDIVIVKYPNREGNFIKRTIGLPGETIEVINSTVYVDGQPLEEDYVSEYPYADMAPVVVPEDHIFVMGDNRYNSSDSRSPQVGPIPHSSIVGHGLFVIWPFSQAHMITQ